MKFGVILVAIAFFVFASGAYAALTDGLVGYWSFNDGTAKDNSGAENHGKFLGAPKSVAGKMGKCLDFNGKNDGIDIEDKASVQLDKALTVAAWINVRKFVDHAGVCWKGEKIGWGENFNWRIATTGNGLTWGTTVKGAENWFATGGAVTLNTWAFICMTADGKQAIAYVAKDGKTLDKPASNEGNPKASVAPYNVWKGQPVRIGYSQGRGGDLKTVDYFDGLIDEVMLFNRALSEAEVKEIMAKDLSTTAVGSLGKASTTWGNIKSY